MILYDPPSLSVSPGLSPSSSNQQQMLGECVKKISFPQWALPVLNSWNFELSQSLYLDSYIKQEWRVPHSPFKGELIL